LPGTSRVSSRIRTGCRLTLKYAVQNLIDIFKDNWYYIIKEELRQQVSEESLKKHKFLITQELNVLKRVIKELSLVYKEAPERKAVVPPEEEAEIEEEVETTETGVDNEKVDENYELSQKDTSKNFVLQNINQYTNLINHTLIKINYRDDKLDYEQLNFNNAEIFTAPDDWMRIIAIKYYYGYVFPGRVDYMCTTQMDPQLKLADGEGLALKPVQTYSYAKLWVAEDIPGEMIQEVIENEDIKTIQGGYVYTIKPVGEVEIFIDSEQTEIPYKDAEGRTVLPFVLTSLHYPVDYLLDFTTGNDLRELNINVAILMIWLNNIAKYQTFKQIVFNTDSPDKIPDGMRINPDDILINPTREGEGSVQVLDLQTRILDLFQLIKERIQTVLAGYGISPENFTMSASPQSGFALKISNMGKLEARQTQLPSYSVFEKKIFDVERVVWNYHRPKEKIADNAELIVDFAELEFPKSPKEKAEEFNFLFNHNIATEIDLMMKYNPEMTREQAEEEYAKNKAFNEANQPAPVQLNPVRQPGNPAQTPQRQGPPQAQVGTSNGQN
jgi:hypothetical protein